MVKIVRHQQSYDAELAEKAQLRCYRVDLAENGKPIYREHIMPIVQFTTEKTPWWKKPAPKKTRSKPSKAAK